MIDKQGLIDKAKSIEDAKNRVQGTASRADTMSKMVGEKLQIRITVSNGNRSTEICMDRGRDTHEALVKLAHGIILEDHDNAVAKLDDLLNGDYNRLVEHVRTIVDGGNK